MADINANVGLNLSDGGINKVLADLDAGIEKALTKLTKLGDVAAGAGGKLTKKATQELGNIDAQAKSLQRLMQQINTITNAQNAGAKKGVSGLLGTGLDDQKIAKQVQSVREFRRTLEESTTTADKLKARINAITTETANLARAGQSQTDGQIRKQEQLTRTLKEYETLSSKLSTTTTRIGALSPENQAKLEQFTLRAQELKRVFNDLAGDNRRTNFAFLTDAMRTINAELEKEISLLTRAEAQEAKLLQNTRARGQELLNQTSRDRQIALERATGNLSNRLTPAQAAFGSAIGDQGLENRLMRVTSAYGAAKRNLEAALKTDSGATDLQISKLIGQVERFDRKIIETIALQQRRGREAVTAARAEETQIDRVIAANERLKRLQTQITTKEITRGIRDSESALRDFDKQLAALDATGKETLSPLSKAFKGLLGDGGAGLAARVAIYSVAASAIYGIINAAKDGVKFVIDFEDKLATLQAISGATNTQMTSLSAAILEVGTRSRFSVLDLAEATTQLAQAGFSVGDIRSSLGAVSDFAAASGTSVKESVDLITGALGAFQLQASEAGRVSDIFTAALNRSKLTSQQIAQAIQYVGTTAFEQNVSLEQLVATIGSVAQAGVRSGSTLGTGFRQFLVDLANPTKKLTEELGKLGLTQADVDVKTRGLNGVLKTLRDSGFGAAQAYEGLEVRAAAFFLAAKNNIDVSQRLQLAESQRGVATEASARAMDSLSAQTQRLQNILGKLASETVPLDFLKNLAKEAANLAEKLGATSDEFYELQKAQQGGLAPDIVQKFQTAAEYTAKLGQEQQNLEQGLYNLATTGKYYGETADTIAEQNEKLATATANASDATATQAQKVQSVQGEFQKLLTQGPTLRGDSIETAIITNQLTTRFEGLASMLGNSANAYDNLIAAMKRYNVQQLKMLGDKAGGEAAAAQNQFRGQTAQANADVQNILRQLNPAQRREFRGLITNQDKGGGINAINDFATRVGGAAGQAITKAVPNLANRLATRQQGLAAQRLSQDAATQANPLFQQVSNRNQSTNAALGRTLAQAAGASPAQRARMFQGILGDLDATDKQVDALLQANKGNERVVRNLLQLKSDTASQRRQIQGEIKPTSEENKTATREAKAAQRAREKAEREAQRARDTFNRNELSVSQSQLKASDKALSAFINGQKLDFNLDDLEEMFEEGDDLLNEWIKARREVLSDAITKQGLNPSQIKDLTDAANDEIKAKQQSTIQRQTEVLGRAITRFVTDSVRSIENNFDLKSTDSIQAIGRQQGLRTGLDNPLLRGVPDYTKTIQQRRLDLAQDSRNRELIGTQGADGMFSGGLNEQRIEDYTALMEKASEKLQELEERRDAADKAGNTTAVAAYGQQIRQTAAEINELTLKTQDLQIANDGLRAQYQAESLKPQTFGQAIGQAAEAFRINNDIGISLKERLFGGLGGVLEDASRSFSDFFQNVVTGTQSVGQAFGGMAKAVVSAILKMAAQAVATQIFGLLLSFIPGAAPTGGISAQQGLANYGPISLPAIGRWRGGAINNETPQRLISGGSVRGGLPTRDSTLVHAAQGEFMFNRTAVESIGHDLLNDMNNRGSAALNKLRGGNMIMPQSKFDSSVYVVLPEERPQLGENDVLAIVSRDVLRNGATKQLIKQVSAGG